MQLICDTADLLLFLFLFIFGHAVLIIKGKVYFLTHSLYKTESIQFIHLLYIDYVELYGHLPKKEKKKKKKII